MGFYFCKKGVVVDPTSERFKKAVQKLREETVQYVLEHWDWPLGGVRSNMTGRESVELEYFADPEVPEIVDKESYRRRMTKQVTFGGQTELQALSALLNCGIVVHPNSDEDQWELGIYFCSKAGAKNVARRLNVGRRPILHVLYDEKSQHYSAIISK